MRETKPPLFHHQDVDCRTHYGYTARGTQVCIGWVHPPPALAVDKQSIKFDEGANTNLHELYCYKVGGFTQCMGLKQYGGYSKLLLNFLH